jgi:peptide/nickel transport system permease protein
MLAYVVRRIMIMIPTLLVISMISFTIIQLPPGDYLTSLIAELEQSGDPVDRQVIEALNRRYGLDRPIYVQYFIWISGFVQGDMGMSFEANKPVAELIGDRILLTMVVSFTSLLFVYIVAIPIGIYSATHQYSAGDYVFTVLGFLGLATPNFLLALVLLYVAFAFFGQSVGGLFSPEFIEAPWSLAKVWDLIKHLWIPVIVIGTAGTAGRIRVMRANLLDELGKQYVVTARAKGVAEPKLLFKYPVRMAINPMISTVGWLLPQLISGAAITSVVLSLPTTGPLLLRALRNQDMFLAGSFIMLLSTLTVIGTLLSDILLSWVDPRIRFGAREV